MRVAPIDLSVFPDLSPDTFWRSLTPLEERCDMAEKRTLFETRTPTLARTIGSGVRDLVRDVATRAKRLVGASRVAEDVLVDGRRLLDLRVMRLPW